MGDEYKQLDRNEFEALSGFLMSYVYDEDYAIGDPITKIVAEFKGFQEEIDAIVHDIDNLLLREPFPLSEVINTANRSFGSEDAAKKFLTELRGEIAKCEPMPTPTPDLRGLLDPRFRI